ncbi:diaminopimelate epimerase [Halococcus morrhuae DSM 1307]|uniref:Diaminopimelate epimerase n=1 Tax=Halococcus morrhuae DSM 1307 TaxID=931277 RepID=M0MQB9_HALMO|nr:diaminopimelate epimerase [Halococcus morrhuae]EMA47508.1 diaminopimelate epimerase [Halococcus morrhuae DSM 1307]
MNVEKYHGTGNDFFVIDASEPVADRRALAIELCDSDDGLAVGERTGADGVLFLALEDGYASPRVVMTLVQPDGSTAPMCGNGARCAAAWAAERTAAETVMVDTQAGTRRATVDDAEGVTVEMGAASFAPDAVPLAGDEPLLDESVEDLSVTAVDTGVPHAVAFVDDVATVDLDALAPPVRHANRFPHGANVTLASPRDDGFDQRTYERGVEGETRSCGTGAVAIAAVARELGLTERDSVAVRPPGGRLDVRFTARGATLAGPTEREFAGSVSMAASPVVKGGTDGAAGD